MQIWALEAETGALLFVLVAPAMALVWVHRCYRDAGGLVGVPAAVGAAWLLYACGLVAFTLFPLPDAATVCASDAVEGWRLDPRTTVEEVDGLVSLLQLAFNVALFVPLGTLLVYRRHRSVVAAAVAGLAVSLLVELTQGTGVWGLYDCAYRLADVDDVVLNTAGAALGGVLGRWVSRRHPYPSGPPPADPGPPSPARRALSVALDAVALAIAGVVLQVVVLGPVVGVGGAEVVDRTWFDLLGLPMGGLVPAVVLFALVPALRADGASPGQWAALLATRRVGGGSAGPGPVAVRAAVRWLPVVAAIGVGGWAWTLPVATGAAEAVVAWPDRPSLASRLSGTRTVTAASAGGGG